MTNTCSQLDQAKQALRDAAAMSKTRHMLTWAICAAIGRGLQGLDAATLTAAKKELADEGQITTRSVEIHQAVWAVWERTGLPDEAMEIIPHATVRYALEEWGPVQAVGALVGIHDGNQSLFKANLAQLQANLKEARAKGKQTTTAEALLGALGPLAKVPLEQLSEADRRQIMGALGEVLGSHREEE